MVMEEQESAMELDSEKVPVPQVQDAKEIPPAETANKGLSHGKPRLRKKALHAAIVKQMEFYFGDANLSKDRFLANLIEKDPYVDLSLFIEFNKIRELTTDIKRIAKALQKSQMLALSEDGTKVRRVTPIKKRENTDDCTIYVQNLPPDIDHERLTTIFSHYGTVVYVSIPRYKSNRKIKGFAFVEFDTPEDAKNCIKAFQKRGCLLPSHTSPDELLSVTTFDDPSKDVIGDCKFLLNSNTDPSKIDNSSEEEATDSASVANDDHSKPERKRVASESTDQNENEQPATIKKKRRKDSTTSNVESSTAEETTEGNETKNKSTKQEASNTEDENQDDSAQFQEQESDDKGNSSSLKSKKKLAKHKKKRTKSVSEENEEASSSNTKNKSMDFEVSDVLTDATEEAETGKDKKKKRKRKRTRKAEDVNYDIGLQVLAKKDWKRLRNKYLELQRSKMQQLKRHLRKTRNHYEKNRSEREENDDREKAIKGEGIRERFTPGVIVKIDMNEPCTNPKNLKMELRSNSAIKYIDVSEGCYRAHVRFDSAEAAQAFAQKSTKERHMSVLHGKEEQLYWDKIYRDREEKLSMKPKNKQRGRQKLLKRAEKELGKHIKFDNTQEA